MGPHLADREWIQVLRETIQKTLGAGSYSAPRAARAYFPSKPFFDLFNAIPALKSMCRTLLGRSRWH